MDIIIKEFEKTNIDSMVDIWNEVVLAANAFPQEETLNNSQAYDFFSSQSCTAVAVDSNTNEILGLYILHPNNIGRCSHIANASFAVKSSFRGCGIGEKLVTDCLKRAKDIGFKILQFNAVVKTNVSARKLYSKLGFTEIGTVPNGFKCSNGKYEDIVLYYYTL